MMLSGMRAITDQTLVSDRESVFVYFILVLTLHLHHINRNLLLPHAEDFKVGDHTLKRIKNK